MKRIDISILIALAVAVFLIVAGCNNGGTRISSILQSPDSYMSKEVAIGGQVTKSYSVNLLVSEIGAYQVDDGTGKIWVISRTDVPPEGSKVGLKGTVGSGIKFGREIFGTLIREKERSVR